MVKLEDAVIARFEEKGNMFELLVDSELAMELKKGEKVNFNELLAIDRVFKDAKKGEEASEHKVKEVFKTEDINVIAKKIICDGSVQLTTEQRKKMAERRRKELIEFISKNSLNPQTNTPHPPQRIENVLEEAKILIDLNKSLKEQLKDALPKIKKLIPISIEKLSIAVKIPAQFAGKATHLLHNYSIKKEEWEKDGSLVVLLELPPGQKQELFNELNHLTHGDIETKILNE